MSNNKQFLSSFNNIEDYLKDESDTASSSFKYLLAQISSKNKVIAHYESELNTLRELRNFIVHGNIEAPLAIVSDSTVKRIKSIEKAIITPIKIREVFSQKVFTVNEDDTLIEVLKIIKDKKFSQFPVIGKEGFVGLVTDNGITNWLANNMEEDNISIKKTCIRDVMIDDEEVDSYAFLYSYSSLYEVIKEFDKGRALKNRSFTIIVLKRKNDKVMLKDIYTILTPWDLNKVYRSLGLKE